MERKPKGFQSYSNSPLAPYRDSKDIKTVSDPDSVRLRAAAADARANEQARIVVGCMVGAALCVALTAAPPIVSVVVACVLTFLSCVGIAVAKAGQ